MSSGLKTVGLFGLRSAAIPRASYLEPLRVPEGVIKRSIHSLFNSANPRETLNKAHDISPTPSAHGHRRHFAIKSSFISTRNHQSLSHSNQQDMDVPPGVFRGSVDRFNGVTIDSATEFEGTDDFVKKLKKSLDYWAETKRRAIWFKVHSAHSEWVPHLTQADFSFHHCQGDSVVLYRWLPQDEYVNIPVYSHTMMGVGGLVVNERNEVLVVSDRYAMIPNSWKLPGGYVEPRENLIDAAIREVREETGIESEFHTVISLRHSHGGSFGCSDVYVVVALRPTTLELTRCEREIARVQWMPVQEYLEHPHVHETNRHFMRSFLDYEKRGIRFTCEKAVHQVLKREYCLYFMKPIDNEEEGKPDQHQNSSNIVSH